MEWYLVKLYVFEPLSGWTPAEAPAVRKDWRKFGASPTQDVRLILYYNPLLLPSCCTGYLQILPNCYLSSVHHLIPEDLWCSLFSSFTVCMQYTLCTVPLYQVSDLQGTVLIQDVYNLAERHSKPGSGNNLRKDSVCWGFSQGLPSTQYKRKSKSSVHNVRKRKSKLNEILRAISNCTIKHVVRTPA